jgi:sterol desaturase/sphingolipid hydroxylase (fatty acid hydroxylase superfamily)
MRRSQTTGWHTEGGLVGDQPCHRTGYGIASFVFGIFIGSHLHAQRRQPKPFKADSPLRRLDARQAMLAVSVARVIGLVVMAVFWLYAAYTLWHL